MGENDDARDGSGWADFRGTKRSNETHESKTDPEARLLERATRMTSAPDRGG